MFQIANETALLGQNNPNFMCKKINLDLRMFTEAAMMSTDFSIVFRVQNLKFQNSYSARGGIVNLDFFQLNDIHLENFCMAQRWCSGYDE